MCRGGNTAEYPTISLTRYGQCKSPYIIDLHINIFFPRLFLHQISFSHLRNDSHKTQTMPKMRSKYDVGNRRVRRDEARELVWNDGQFMVVGEKDEACEG